jgi:hypothetical protein
MTEIKTMNEAPGERRAIEMQVAPQNDVLGGSKRVMDCFFLEERTHQVIENKHPRPVPATNEPKRTHQAIEKKWVSWI